MSKIEQFQGLKDGSYYNICNREEQLALTFDSESDPPVLCFKPLDPGSLTQIWMVEQMKQNCYEIVHAYSTNVLTLSKDGAWVAPGRQSSNQLFFVQKSDPKNNPIEYWLRENKQSDRYIMSEKGKVSWGIANPKASKCRWQLTRISKQNVLYRSCLLQFAFSGLYLDVPQSSTKQGTTLIQYPLNARCNQRWQIKRAPQDPDCYRIISVRSKLCMTIRGRSERDRTPIVQSIMQKDNMGQLWRLKHEGLSLYVIESRLKDGLYLGVKNHQMNEMASIATTISEQYAFWRIVGNFE